MDGVLYCEQFRWTGEDWVPLFELEGEVADLAALGDTLLIGGAFETINGSPTDHLVAWFDGALVSGVEGIDDVVKGVEVWQGQPVVLKGEQVEIEPVVTLISTGWVELGNLRMDILVRPGEATEISLRGLQRIDDRLYITETSHSWDWSYDYDSFTLLEFVDDRWTERLDSSYTTSVQALTMWDDNLVLGGRFDTIAGVSARNIAFFSTQITAVVDESGLGFANGIGRMAAADGVVLVVPSYTPSSGLRTYRWLDGSWGTHFIPASIANPTRRFQSLEIAGGFVIGGYTWWFSGPGGSSGEGTVTAIQGESPWRGVPGLDSYGVDVAALDGVPHIITQSAIYQYDDGVGASPIATADGTLRLLAEDGDGLVLVGNFTHLDSLAVGPVARYAEGQWTSIAPTREGTIFELQRHGDRLIARFRPGSSFNPEPQILLRFDGELWHEFGPTLPGTLRRMVSFDGDLIVWVETDDARHLLLKVTDTTWEPLTDPIDADIDGIASDGERLWVYGDFLRIGDVPAAGITYWRSTPTPVFLSDLQARRTGVGVALSWNLHGDHGETLAVTRTDGGVRSTLATLESTLGETTWTDARAPLGATEYALHSVSPTGELTELRSVEVPALDGPPILDLLAAPNPFNPMVVLSPRIPAQGHVTVSVHDLRGRTVVRLFDGAAALCPTSLQWDGVDERGARVGSGAYMARMTVDGRVVTRKIVLAR